MMSPRGPAWARRLLRLALSAEDYEEMVDDLDELYLSIWHARGRRRAAGWYWVRVLESLPVLWADRVKWSVMMWHNYLKVALRNLKRDRVHAVVNIAGLAVGLACTLLILLWVQDEVSYNRFHTHGDTIYRVVNRRTDRASTSSQAPAPLADVMLKEIPEIESAVRFLFRDEVELRLDGRSLGGWRGASADPQVFDVFSFPLNEGAAATALEAPDAIVISETLARACFGGEDAMGRLIEVQDALLTVTGVVADVPGHSDIQFDYLRPHLSNPELVKYDRFIWNWFAFHLYVKVHDGVSAEAVDAKVGDFLNTYRASSEGNLKVFLQPLARMHLWHLDGGGPIQYVLVFTGVALLILALAGINFVNLSTAMAGHRAKEVGLRKVVGSGRAEIIRQFLGESMVVTVLAGGVALVLAALCLPAFNTLSGKTLVLGLLGGRGMALFLALLIGTGLLAGAYPAFLLSAMRPVKTLRGESALARGRRGHRRMGLRGLLVILQFTLSIGLMISTVVVHRQIKYMLNADLGFNQQHLVMLTLPESTGKARDALSAMKETLLASPCIRSVSGRGPTGRGGRLDWAGMPQDKNAVEYLNNQVRYFVVDAEYSETHEMHWLQGRFFSDEMTGDYHSAYVLNEAAVKLWDLESPLGMAFSLNGKAGRIIGVYQSMHRSGVKEAAGPEVLYMEAATPWDRWAALTVRFDPNAGRDALAVLQNVWTQFYPETPFEVQFVDEEIRSVYDMEYRLSTLFSVFTGLALFISCMGLFSLISFLAQQRRKEIGIRKTLGASVWQIWTLLSSTFGAWVVISNVIAWPLAYLAMRRWLENYPYASELALWIFPAVAGGAILIATLTISVQAVSAALANPVKSLHNE